MANSPCYPSQMGARPTHAPDAIYQSTPFSPAQRIGFSSSSIRRVPTTAVYVPLLIPETKISSRQQRPASNPTSKPAQSQTLIRLSVHGWTLRTLLRSGSGNVLPPKMYPWVGTQVASPRSRLSRLAKRPTLTAYRRPRLHRRRLSQNRRDPTG